MSKFDKFFCKLASFFLDVLCIWLMWGDIAPLLGLPVLDFLQIMELTLIVRFIVPSIPKD